MTFDPIPYAAGAAFLHWLTVIGISAAMILGVSLLTSLVSFGISGPVSLVRHVRGGIADSLHIGGRRVWALALLTVKESLRRKALLVFVLFALLFMFMGWFLPQAGDLGNELQIKIRVTSVLKAVSWLVGPVVLLLACWGVPQDIRQRSLHTVVTKPVRRIEIVLGRMLGFTLVGTLLVVVMGSVGYMWLLREIPEDAKSSLFCRVPIHGELKFLDRNGNPVDKGINVGYEWEHRGYIEGATSARAVWTFNNLDVDQFGDSLKIEWRFEAFRTHKGDMDRGLLSQIWVVHEGENGIPPIDVTIHPVREFHFSDEENTVIIPRKLTYRDEQQRTEVEADLFDEVISDGTLRIEVACLDSGQYLGMAQSDLFIRTEDRDFVVGYAKAVFGIWLDMVLIVLLAVSASCLVKAPIAVLSTLSLIFVGLVFRDTMDGVITGDLDGGGPVESAYRMGMHYNQTMDLERTVPIAIMKGVDYILIQCMWLVRHIIPNFEYFQMSPYVANGFDVDWNAAVLPGLMMTAAYVVPCVIFGYYALRLRELEAK